jgi:hypothetical protein
MKTTSDANHHSEQGRQQHLRQIGIADGNAAAQADLDAAA